MAVIFRDNVQVSHVLWTECWWPSAYAACAVAAVRHKEPDTVWMSALLSCFISILLSCSLSTSLGNSPAPAFLFHFSSLVYFSALALMLLSSISSSLEYCLAPALLISCSLSTKSGYPSTHESFESLQDLTTLLLFLSYCLACSLPPFATLLLSGSLFPNLKYSPDPALLFPCPLSPIVGQSTAYSILLSCSLSATLGYFPDQSFCSLHPVLLLAVYNFGYSPDPTLLLSRSLSPSFMLLVSCFHASSVQIWAANHVSITTV